MNAAFVYAEQANAPLFVAPDVLATSLDIKIAGVPGKIWTPKFGTKLPDRDFYEVVAPDRFYDDLLPRLQGAEEIDWGRQYSHPGRDCLLSTFVLEFELSGNQDEVREQISLIEEGLPHWFGVVRDWLEVLTLQDLATDYTLGLSNSRPQHQWSWQNALTKSNIFGIRSSIEIRMLMGTATIDRLRWARALGEANILQSPPSPYLVLRDARNMRMRRSHSYSLALSAIAAESELSEQVRAELANAGKSAAEIASVLMKTFGGLVTYCQTNLPQITLPPDCHTKLVDVRNKVIHHGYQASFQESLEAHNIAEKIIGLRPL